MHLLVCLGDIDRVPHSACVRAQAPRTSPGLAPGAGSVSGPGAAEEESGWPQSQPSSLLWVMGTWTQVLIAVTANSYLMLAMHQALFQAICI